MLDNTGVVTPEGQSLESFLLISEPARDHILEVVGTKTGNRSELLSERILRKAIRSAVEVPGSNVSMVKLVEDELGKALSVTLNIDKTPLNIYLTVDKFKQVM